MICETESGVTHVLCAMRDSFWIISRSLLDHYRHAKGPSIPVIPLVEVILPAYHLPRMGISEEVDVYYPLHSPGNASVGKAADVRRLRILLENYLGDHKHIYKWSKCTASGSGQQSVSDAPLYIFYLFFELFSWVLEWLHRRDVAFSRACLNKSPSSLQSRIDGTQNHEGVILWFLFR